MVAEGGPSDEGTGDTETGGNEAGVSLSLDAALEVLAHHQRREILRYLIDESDQATTVDELVLHLVGREMDRTNTRPGHDQIEMEIHHIHLPKLVEAGIVDYDARSKEMRYWRDESLEDLLESVESYDAS